MRKWVTLMSNYRFGFGRKSKKICVQLRAKRHLCTQWNLKSDNLQYNTLGCLDKRLIDQASDFPSIIFSIILLIKWCPIFDSSPLVQNSKFNNLLWVHWFLCKNLSNFGYPAWKLHNPYCHSGHIRKPIIKMEVILFVRINFPCPWIEPA